MNGNEIDIVTLGELIIAKRAELQTGPFGTQLHASSYVRQGVPVVAVKNIGANVLVANDIPRITEDDASRLSRYRLLENDILFSRKGAVERRALVRAKEQGWLQGSDCIRLRFDGSVNAKYVSYFLGSAQAQQWLTQHAHGATMPSLNQAILSLLPVPLPPLPEQRGIAHILGTLDDKIELNRQMNGTLDEIARTLFRSWFVDFDPVRANMEGPQPYGMDAETAAVFPDRLVDSEFGPIPEGWEWRPLDHIGVFLNGLALQKYPPKSDGSDLPAIKIAQLRVNNTTGASLANRDVPKPYQIADGDFLFSWSGTLLASIWSGGEGALNQHLFKVTSNFPQWFVYQWVQEHLDHFRGVAADKATTMGHINRHHLSAAMCAVPLDEQLFGAADAVLGDVTALALNNSLESRTLADMRDALLPELLSGRTHATKVEVQ